jgi:LPXTG-motif cell wall-anchored protein
MKTRTTIAAAAFVLGMSIGVPAVVAQTYPLETPSTTDTGGTSDTGDNAQQQDGGAVAGAQERAQARGTLPVTGGDVAGLALMGVGAVAAGAVIMRRTRQS